MITVQDVPTRRFPRRLIRKLESPDLPIGILVAVWELRTYLDELEEEAILNARRLGASAKDIAEAQHISRQAVYHKLRSIERRRKPAEVVAIPDVESHRSERYR